MVEGAEVIGWEAAAIAVCLLLSAFFSSSETALTALGKAEAQRMVEEDGWWSRALKLWVNQPLRVLTCILIGNNIVNITASALATALADRLLEGRETAVPIAIGAMTLLLLTFGEITPKTVAKQRYKDLVGPMMWALRLPYVLFYPATVVFVWLTKAMMKIAGTDLNEQGPQVTEEELEFLVGLGSREGSLAAGTATLLQSAFEYTSTTVKEVMVPRSELVMLDVDWSYEQTLELLTQSGHSRVPVYEDTVDNIIGLFYAKDLLQITQDEEGFDIRSHLREARFVPEQKKISDLLTQFKRSRVHMALVVDEFGDIRGLITLEDIIEEFFGEIQDEYDAEEVYIRDLEPGRVLVDARCPLEELEAHLSYQFPEHPEYETLGGFVVTELGAVPSVEASISKDGLKFCVKEADAKKVIQVEIIDERALQSREGRAPAEGQVSRLAS